MDGQVLTEIAHERSTYVVTVAFKDHDDKAVTPSTASWTLTKGDGVVVNSRSNVSISNPGSVETIVLQGADLAILDGFEEEWRVLTVNFTYNALGYVGLPGKNSFRFKVRNMVAVT